jgi:hypothetical protein
MVQLGQSEYLIRLQPVNDVVPSNDDVYMKCLLTNDLSLLRLWHGEALP